MTQQSDVSESTETIGKAPLRSLVFDPVQYYTQTDRAELLRSHLLCGQPTRQTFNWRQVGQAKLALQGKMAGRIWGEWDSIACRKKAREGAGMRASARKSNVTRF